jgi:hypothetical protein
MLREILSSAARRKVRVERNQFGFRMSRELVWQAPPACLRSKDRRRSASATGTRYPDPTTASNFVRKHKAEYLSKLAFFS